MEIFSFTQLQSSNVFVPGATNFLNTRSYNSSLPKAYLNWIFFDDQFKMVGTGSGVQQVGTNNTFTVLAQSGVTAAKNGFLYVYVSNETPNINVYFDNLQVTSYSSPLLQEQSYYPFGLQMAGISDKALNKLDSKNKFNGGVELEEDYGVNLYETFYRGYDPQIGRFEGVDVLSERSMGMSVYGFSGNNPVMFNDPKGDKACSKCISFGSIDYANYNNQGSFDFMDGFNDDALTRMSAGGGDESSNNFGSFWNSLLNQVSDGFAVFKDFSTEIGTDKHGQTGTWFHYTEVLNDGVYGGIGNLTSLNTISLGSIFIAGVNGDGSSFPNFATLLSNYPKPYEPGPYPQSIYYNQCAIRMSIALLNSGVDLSGVKNYSNPGGITRTKRGEVLGAYNLARFLRNNDELGNPKVFDGTQQNVATLISGQTGIIFFQDFMEETRSDQNTHIDLWDGSNIQAPYYDQMMDSKKIWFWPVK